MDTKQLTDPDFLRKFRQTKEYRIKDKIIKILVCWIFPKSLRKRCRRFLAWKFGIGIRPESLLEKIRYQKTQKKFIADFHRHKPFNYRIVSLGCDCLSRTIPTLWGVKPRSSEGEPSGPFDLSVNPLPGLLKNLKNDFNGFLEQMEYDPAINYWTIPADGIKYFHEYDCGPDKGEKLRARFAKRIENIRYSLRYDATPTLYISHYSAKVCATPPEETAKLYNDLYNFLKTTRGGRKFALLVVDFSKTVNPGKLARGIYAYTPDYLEADYVWHQDEFKFSARGLKFELGLMQTIVSVLNKLQKN